MVLNKIKAVIIDDDADTVEVSAMFLQLYSFDVIGTGFNGKDAMELFESLRPDVVFMDLMMPEYDGFFGLENIRKIDPNANIIVVTADMRQDTTERLKLLNPTKIIYKPFNKNDIIEISKMLTGQTKALTV